MPFGFGSKKNRSPELPLNGHAINNNVTRSKSASSNGDENNLQNSVGDGEGYKTPSQMPKLVFQCQLAHGSPTVYVSGFSNMKELYDKIAECYHFPASDVSIRELRKSDE